VLIHTLGQLPLLDATAIKTNIFAFGSNGVISKLLRRVTWTNLNLSQSLPWVHNHLLPHHLFSLPQINLVTHKVQKFWPIMVSADTLAGSTTI
jgi:hypothetical protein